MRGFERLATNGSGTGRVALPIGLKLWVTVLVVVAVASALLFVELSNRERQRLVEGKARASSMVVDLLAASLAAPLDFEDVDAAQKELVHARANSEVVWAGVFAPTGDRLVAQAGDVARAPAARPPEGSRIGENAVEVARTVRDPKGKELGRAVLVLSLDAENAAFAATRSDTLRLCVLLALGTATVLMLVTRRQIVTPLGRLAEAARRLEAGGRAERVDVTSRDEVGALATAFNSMSEAVVDRETRLAEARREVQELLDNMRQAIVVFGGDGRVVGVASRAAHEVFGHEDLTGTSIVDLLAPEDEVWQVERRALVEWIELAALVGEDGWEDIEPLAPRSVLLPRAGQAPRALELEMRPLEGTPRRIMMLATDVTDRLALEAARDREAREASALRAVVGTGHVFIAFLDGARQRLAIARELSASPLDGAKRDAVFRHLHTIRGEAHVFELSGVVAAASDAEQALAHGGERDSDLTGPGSRAVVNDSASLRASLDALEVALDAARERFVAIAGEGAASRVPVDGAALAKLVELTAGRSDAIAQAVRRVAARPFGELVTTIADRVPQWAESLGKRARLEVVGRDEPVPDELARVLRSAMVHLVRNAIAHGIEAPEERARAGKDEIGVVTLRCESRGGDTTVVIEDDGGGIDDASRERIFDAGYSTADAGGELAGLGVGLFAVREELLRASYVVSLTSAPAAGARFELRPSGRPSTERTAT